VQCLKIQSGWIMEGQISEELISDASVIRLSDGRYRIYSNDKVDAPPRLVYSLISNDGLNFAREADYRLVGDAEHDAFAPAVVAVPDGRFRMYLTDQRTHIGDVGAPAIISSISSDGLTFTWEGGNRLTYTGTGNEVGGIRGSSALRLPDGGWRMYYLGLTGSGRDCKVLSAVSPDGLTWTREAGVRFEPTMLCPATRSSGSLAVFLDDSGVYHWFISGAACDDADHRNEKIGIFHGTSTDGLSFTVSKDPVVQGYYIGSQYHGNPGDPFIAAEDAMLVLSPEGLRMYFAVGIVGDPGVRYYSIQNRDIR
jgi:hypothetical protein